MMKKCLTAVFFAVLLFCIIPVSNASAAQSVRVSLPNTPVTLDGQTFSSDYSRYPFLVYRDITYFPMTFDNCRLLGLRTTWTAEDGLVIEKSSQPVSEYTREVQTAKNSRTQTARTAEGKIIVNGKAIDNSREQYPLLVFRDVTYFPLTWRFAVDEFGWNASFDAVNGLSVSNPAVSLTCTDDWTGAGEHYEAIPGVDIDTPLACLFYAPINGYSSAPEPVLSIYNVLGEDVTLLPDDFQWEYQVYRVTGGGDELIYRKAIPFYSGSILQYHFVHWTINDGYDYSRSGKGTYRAVLVHPDDMLYQSAGSTLSAPVEGRGYAVKFSREFTLS